MKFKALSAIVILCAATPVFAQDASVIRPHHVHHHRDFRGSYNQVGPATYAIPLSALRTESEAPWLYFHPANGG